MTVGAVIVTFGPDEHVLKALLSAIDNQVSWICLVDNTESSNDIVTRLVIDSELDVDRVLLIRHGCNRGIAYGLNTGISALLACGVDHVLLLDQDSSPSSDMVAQLERALLALQDSGELVAAVGPTFTDIHTGLTFPFQARVPGVFFHGKTSPSEAAPTVSALTLITSGTLIPATAVQSIGLMLEELFIDFVDTEWCLRAISLGYSLHGVGAARMSHRMGDASLRVWYLRWRNETEYPPVRLYYRTRNLVILCKKKYISPRWKLRSTWYNLGVAYTQIFYGKERWRSFAMAAKGFLHGIIGKAGAYRL